MKKYRITAALLAVVMLLGVLSACSASEKGSNDGTKAETPSANPNVSRLDAQSVSSKYAYAAEYIDLPDGIEYVGDSCIGESKLFFTASVVDGQESYTDAVTGETYTFDNYVTKLFCMDLATHECSALGDLDASDDENADEDGWIYDSYVSAMAAGAGDTVWVCQNTTSYRYNLPENFDESTDKRYNYYEEGESGYEIVQMDAEGNVLNKLSMDAANAEIDDGDYFYISSMIVDTNGYIYVGNWSVVLLYDKDGTLLRSFDVSDLGGNLSQYRADQVGVVSYGETRCIKLIDPNTKDWGETIKVPSNAYNNIYPGSGDYDLYYDYNSKIYGYNAETDTTEKVLDWLECDMNEPSTYRVLADGRVLAVSSEWDNGENTSQVTILTPVAAEEQEEKTVLTLACMYLDYNLRNQIIAFNRASSKYRIVVNDYSEYITDEENSYQNAITKLNTEILSGNLPDLILGDNLPINRYAAKGMLLDLWEFIDADENINREDLMEPVLNAASTDGKLYSIGSSFSVITAVGLGKVVDAYDSWTLDAAKDAMTKLQSGATVLGDMYTQESAVSGILARNISSFIDWKTGECTFDSQEFIDLLEFIKQFPASFDYDNYDWETDYESDYKRIREGRQLLTQEYITDFGSLYVQYAALNDDASFVGLPAGPAASAFNMETPLSITVACADKDAAWAFVRTILQEDYQTNEVWDFPIVKKYFEESAAKAMEQEYELDENGNQILDENGEPIKVSNGGYGFGNDEMYEIYAVTQEQYDDLMALINSITAMNSYDTNIMTIIEAVTPSFLSGEKSAEDAAKEIQNRVGLYVAEQS